MVTRTELTAHCPLNKAWPVPRFYPGAQCFPSVLPAEMLNAGPCHQPRLGSANGRVRSDRQLAGLRPSRPAGAAPSGGWHPVIATHARAGWTEVWMDTLVTIVLGVPAEAAARWATKVRHAFRWFAAVEAVCSRFS